MRSHITLVLVAAVMIAGASAAPAAPQLAGGCTPGMHQVSVGGRPGFRFCGAASAVVHVGGRTVRYREGLCRQTAPFFHVSIGTFVPGLRTGKPSYFGITTHTAKPGNQLNAAVAFAYDGRGYAVADQLVTLAPGLQSGTFSGRIVGSKTRVTGSFSC
jgi:hypothetical protein